MDSMFSNVPIFGLIVLFIGTVVAEAPYIVYWIATFFITFFIGMMFRVSGLKKIGIWIGLFLVLNIPPLVVPVYSYYQFVSLCKVEGYYKIYDTVELGPEHWYESGEAKFFNTRGGWSEGYVVGNEIFKAVDLSSFPSRAVYNYKLNIVAETQKRILIEYSDVIWKPEKFNFVSKMYQKLKMKSCSDFESISVPNFYDVRNMVFVKEI